MVGWIPEWIRPNGFLNDLRGQFGGVMEKITQSPLFHFVHSVLTFVTFNTHFFISERIRFLKQNITNNSDFNLYQKLFAFLGWCLSFAIGVPARFISCVMLGILEGLKTTHYNFLLVYIRDKLHIMRYHLQYFHTPINLVLGLISRYWIAHAWFGEINFSTMYVVFVYALWCNYLNFLDGIVSPRVMRFIYHVWAFVALFFNIRYYGYTFVIWDLFVVFATVTVSSAMATRNKEFDTIVLCPMVEETAKSFMYNPVLFGYFEFHSRDTSFSTARVVMAHMEFRMSPSPLLYHMWWNFTSQCAASFMIPQNDLSTRVHNFTKSLKFKIILRLLESYFPNPRQTMAVATHIACILTCESMSALVAQISNIGAHYGTFEFFLSIKTFATQMLSELPTFRTEAAGDSFLSGLDVFTDTLSTCANSEMYMWFKKLVTGLMVIPIFEQYDLKFRAEQLGVFDRAIAKEFRTDKLKFLESVAVSFQHVVRTGVFMISDGLTYQEAVLRLSPVSNFSQNCRELRLKQHFIHEYATNDEFMNRREFESLLHYTTEEGQRMLNSSSFIDFGVRNTVQREMRELENISARLLRENLSRDKPSAFIVLTVAASGVGKSVFTKLTHSVMEEARGRKFHPRVVANILPGEMDFQDNITNGTNIVHIEEVGIETRKQAELNGASTTSLLLMYGDSNPQVVNKSAVEEKGRTINRNEFVTACSNFIDMNARFTTREPYAIYRRVTIQEIRIRPEIAGEDGRLDEAKIAELGVHYKDIYQARFVTIDPPDKIGGLVYEGNTPRYRTYTEWMSVHEWSQELRSKIIDHFRKQDLRHSVVSSVSDMCEHHSWRELCPECSGEEHSLSESEQEFKTEALKDYVPIQYVLCFQDFLWSLWWYCITSLIRLCFTPLPFFFTFYLYMSTTTGFGLLIRILANNYFIEWFFDWTVVIDFAREVSYRNMMNFIQRKPLTAVDLDNSLVRSSFRRLRNLATIHWYVDFAAGLVASYIGLRIIKAILEWFSRPTYKEEGQAFSAPPSQPRTREQIIDLQRELFRAERAKPSKKKNMFYDLTRVDLFNSDSRLSHPDEHCVNAVLGNIFHITATSGDRQFSFHAVAIYPQVLVFNTHSIARNCTEPIAITAKRASATRLAGYTNYVLKDRDLVVVDQDVSLMYIPSLQARDITRWIPRGRLPNELMRGIAVDGYILHGEPNDNEAHTHKNKIQAMADVYSFSNYSDVPCFAYDYVDHGEGVCGSPVVVKLGDGWRFAGIHAANREQTDYCISVYIDGSKIASGIETILENRSLERLVPEGHVLLFNIGEGAPVLGKPDPKSFLNWQGGNANYLCTIKNLTYNKPRPKLAYLPTAPLLKEVMGWENKHPSGDYLWAAPDFKEHFSESEDLGFYSPYHKWASKAFQSDAGVDTDYVERAMESFWARICRENTNWSAQPLDIDSVVAGDSEVHEIRKVNLKSSMGFGYDKKKADYTYGVYLEQAPDGQMFNDEILGAFQDALDQYLSGMTYCPISKASLKAEPRPVASDGTVKQPRVFCATPIVDVLIGRTFLLPLLMIFTSNTDIFECTVGVNSMSEEWGKIRKRFEPVIDRCFGTDISGYDTRMPIAVKHAAMTILMRMAEKCGYNEAAKQVLRGYLTDCLFPILLVKNDLLQMPNVNVSGRVGTAEFNSLCLSIIHRMVFYYLCDKENFEGNFERDVVLITYGDDSKTGSHVDFFNQKSFCEGAEKFGIIATSASKTTSFTTFVPFDGEEFLHRKWRWDEEYQVWCAPLEVTSLMRSLTINNVSSIGLNLQTLEAARAANWEFAQHGRQFFDEHMPKLKELLIRSGVVVKIDESYFKSFDDIMKSCY